METILQDLPHVCVYLDDILVTGPNEQEHLTTLEEVFRRLDKAGVSKKCEFMLPSIEYLGHRISAEGVATDGQQDQGSQKHPGPNQRLTTEVIPRVTELLW